MASTQLYFEGSWSILSTIGLVNVINGLTVISIIGVTPIALVPVLISVATAIANGLCYYAYYAHYGKRSTVAAAALADVFWLVRGSSNYYPSRAQVTECIPDKLNRFKKLGSRSTAT
jgi:hypothetical protein